MSKKEDKKTDIDERMKKVRVREYRKPNNYTVHNPESGMEYGWVTTTDQIQYVAAMGAGWEPVVAADHPNLLEGGYVDPKTGYYMYRELCLCDIPKEAMDDRAVYYARQADMLEGRAKNASVGNNAVNFDNVSEKRPFSESDLL